MIDQIFDRHYQDVRAQMNRDIAHGLRLLGRDALTAFEALARIQFSAPWASRKRTPVHR